MRRVISPGGVSIRGNRAYVLELRKACTAAIRDGSASFISEDEDGDEIGNLIVCTNRLKVLGAKEPIGFKK